MFCVQKRNVSQRRFSSIKTYIFIRIIQIHEVHKYSLFSQSNASQIYSNLQVLQPFTLYAIFRSWHHFLFLDNIEKFQENLSLVLNTFENIMENGAFAPKEQMFHFP